MKHQIVGHMMKTILLILLRTDVSVVTSGDYQRNFVGTDGKVYNHLIDPIPYIQRLILDL